MNNYDDFQNYYRAMPNNNVMEDRNWNFNMNTNINPVIDEQKINHDLFKPYEGFIRGNLYRGLYQGYKLPRPYQVEPMNDQAQLLTYIDSLGFAAHDLNLYLDVHPRDSEMIRLFNEYRKQANKATGEYEKKYGPLFVNSSASDNTEMWAWNQSPWPWEKK